MNTVRTVVVTVTRDELTGTTTTRVDQLGTGNLARCLALEVTTGDYDNATLDRIGQLAGSTARRWMTKLAWNSQLSF